LKTASLLIACIAAKDFLLFNFLIHHSNWFIKTYPQRSKIKFDEKNIDISV